MSKKIDLFKLFTPVLYATMFVIISGLIMLEW